MAWMTIAVEGGFARTAADEASQRSSARSRKSAAHFRLTIGPNGPEADGDHYCCLGSPVPRRDGRAADGVYGSWQWDGKRLIAEVDPLGFQTLFYSHTRGQLVLSPSILQLIALGADTEPDQRALGVFYRIGLFINDDTPFRHIRALPPGGRLVWEDGSLQIERKDWRPTTQSITREAAVEGMIELPRRSIRAIGDAWDAPFVLPLSGGRDSRHILLEFLHQGRPPQMCVTFQHSSGDLDVDALAARAVCERAGAAHAVLGTPRLRHRDILRTLVMTNLCADEHVQMMPLHDFLGTRHWAALDGIGGDILTNPDNDAEAHFQRSQRGDFTGMARAMMHGHASVISLPGKSGGIAGVLSPQSEEEAVAYLAETIESFADAPDPYQAFWFWNRTRREISFVSSAIFASADAVFCPYLDQEFVDFCLSLPYSVTRDQQLHNDAIRIAYPEFADLAYADTFAPRPWQRNGIGIKMRKILDGITTVLELRPDNPIAELREVLKGHPVVYRQPGQVWQLYRLMLASMDAKSAQRLLDVTEAYRIEAPKDLVTDMFSPAGSYVH
jgi:hypothetical protein